MGYQYGYLPSPKDELFENVPTVEDPEVALLDQHSNPTWLAWKESLSIKRLLITVVLVIAIFSSGVFLGVISERIQKTRINNMHSHSGPVETPDGALVTHTAEALGKIEGIDTEGTQCGNNWKEAKAMGCKFDVMASRWYSPEYFDQEVLEGMMTEPQVNFTWYADIKHTQTFSPDKSIQGEFDKIYPDNNYHLKHCLYLWLRLHHAVLKNKPVDEDILSYGHTLHCTRMILQYMEPGFIETTQSSARSGRPFCRNNPVGVLDT